MQNQTSVDIYIRKNLHLKQVWKQNVMNVKKLLHKKKNAKANLVFFTRTCGGCIICFQQQLRKTK